MENILWASSIYGAKTKKGLVKITFEHRDVLISPDEARQFARSVFEAAEAAEVDAFLVTWTQGTVGVDEEHSVQILREFRKWREEHRVDETRRGEG